MEEKQTKPIFDTAINTVAIGLVATGSIQLQNGNFLQGGIMIGIGFVLEFLKYTLRRYKQILK